MEDYFNSESLPGVSSFLPEKKIRASGFPLEISSFSSEFSSMNGETSSKFNESFGKEDLSLANNAHEDRKFVKTSLTLIQKYLLMQESPFNVMRKNLVKETQREKATVLGNLRRADDSKEEASVSCLYPSPIREYLKGNKKKDDNFEIEELVERLRPPKNHKKKLGIIKMVSDAQQNKLKNWMRQRCLNSRNPSKLKLYYNFEKIQMEKLAELADRVSLMKKCGATPQLKFTSQHNQGLSDANIINKFALSEDSMTQYSTMFNQGEYLFLDKETEQPSLKINNEPVQCSQTQLDSRHSTPPINFSNLVTKCEKSDVILGRDLPKGADGTIDSPFSVKKNILYSNKLEDITDMIEDQEEKAPCFDKSTHAADWLTTEFLNFN